MKSEQKQFSVQSKRKPTTVTSYNAKFPAFPVKMLDFFLSFLSGAVSEKLNTHVSFACGKTSSSTDMYLDFLC